MRTDLDLDLDLNLDQFLYYPKRCLVGTHRNYVLTRRELILSATGEGGAVPGQKVLDAYCRVCITTYV